MFRGMASQKVWLWKCCSQRKTLIPLCEGFHGSGTSWNAFDDICGRIGSKSKKQFVPKWYQSSGMDQRVEQLEQTVQSLSGGQEGIAKRLEELFSQLNVRMDQLATQSSQGKHTEPEPRTPESRIRSNDSVATSSYAPKMVKLDFPRYSPHLSVQFEKLLAKVGRLAQNRQVSCFVSGLTTLIRTDVQANWPKTLGEAISLARLYEARNSASGKGLPTQTRPASQMVRPAVLEDSDDDTEMEIEEQDSAEEVPAISLHAIAGFEGPETMRLCGRVVRLDGMVLVDSGSTHNFISEEFARKAGLEPTMRKKIKSTGTAKVAAVERELGDRDDMLRELKRKIQHAQSRMKQIYDLKHQEREFAIGDLVYLKLHPYKQRSLAVRRNFKLSPKYYGPFKVLQKIGAVAYKLELPATAKVHPVFHVSLLKKHFGAGSSVQTQLPQFDDDDEPNPQPEAILDSRIRRNRREVLIHWRGSSPMEATWEELEQIKEQFPEVSLEDKRIA
ncbi:hypothetical protein GH714_040513 [Hevea brasiliensis]|uniref:Chromo domain-containing protein n=1 Tax=Hevea brasiliensis TaxID=3981 RepID=A0A6A6MV80_HEVBR|nr:hypothetical protein GH714_040513 [Hevea brasiliensis]